MNPSEDSYLDETPDSAARMPPPVTTALQLLPLGKLSWDNFERLCLRLAERQGEIEHRGLYGIRGQDQQGIDLLMRLPDGTYRLVQSRRIDELTPGGVRGAVADFMEGKWAARAAQFVLATSASASRTEVQDEIVAQADVLAKKDITFEVWDEERLSRLLKSEPDLVGDFFGPAVRNAFLPGHAAISAEQVFKEFEGRLEDATARVEAALPAPALDETIGPETAGQLLETFLTAGELAPDLTRIFEDLRQASSSEAAVLVAYVRDDPRRARGLIRTPQPWVERGTWQLWNSLGLLASASGDFDDAETAFVRAETTATADERAVLLVRAYEAADNAGKEEQARAHFERARELDSALVAVRLVELQRLESAAERVSQLDDLQPRNDRESANIERVRADSLVELDRFDEALAVVDSMLERDPGSTIALDRRSGITFLVAGEVLRSGSSPDPHALRQAADDSLELRERLRERNRPLETGQLLARAAECCCLTGDRERAREIARSASDEELAERTVRRALAQATFHAGEPQRGVAMLGDENAWEDDDRVLAARALGLSDATEDHHRATALATPYLDDPERRQPAALALLVAAAWDPALPWPEAAATVLAEHHRATVAHLRAERLTLEGREDEAEDLLRKHADDTEVLRALVDRAIQSEAWGRALSLAEQLVQKTDSGEDRLRLANAHRGLGQKDKLREQLHTIANDEKQLAALRSRAFAALSAELPATDYSALEELTARWVQAVPGDRRAVWHRAFALTRLARHDEALPLLEQQGSDVETLDEAHLLAEVLFRTLPSLEAARRIAELSDRFERADEQLEAAVFFAATRTDEVADGALRERIVETIQAFPERFPESTAIRAFKVPEEPEGIVEVFRQQFDPEVAEERARVAKQVSDGEAPIALLATMHGRRIPELIPNLRALPLGYGHAEHAERELDCARRALGGPAAWDPTSLAVLASLPITEQDAVMAALPGSVTAVSSLQECDAAAAGVDERGERSLLAPEGEGLRLIEVDDADLERERTVVQRALALARDLTAVPNSDPEQPDPLDEVLGNDHERPSLDTWPATISVARRRGLPVYSDDRFVRLGAHRERLESFGTEALLHALSERSDITNEQFEQCRLGLLRVGAVGIRASGQELSTVAEENADAPRGLWLHALADHVGWRNDAGGRLRACIGMLQAIWKREPQLLDPWTARVLDCADQALTPLNPQFLARVLLVYTWIGFEETPSHPEHRAFVSALITSVEHAPRLLGIGVFDHVVEQAVEYALLSAPAEPPQMRVAVLRLIIGQLPALVGARVFLAFVE